MPHLVMANGPARGPGNRGIALANTNVVHVTAFS